MRRRLVAEGVRIQDLVRGLFGCCRVARMDLGQRLTFADGVAALLQTKHAHGVVDRVFLRSSTCAESERSDPDRDRTQTADVTGTRGGDFPQFRGDRQRLFARIALLRANPAGRLSNILRCEHTPGWSA